VVPSVEMPPQQTLVLWLSKNTNEELEAAILHIPDRIKNWAKKFGSIESEQVHRFVTSQLVDMRSRRAKKDTAEVGA
jgi:hypothetical protein